jgi:hypothetical protein
MSRWRRFPSTRAETAADLDRISEGRARGRSRADLTSLARDFLMPSMFDRCRRVIRKLAHATGLSEEEIIATAKQDVEYLLLVPELVG